jgi:hypothetical protein
MPLFLVTGPRTIIGDIWNGFGPSADDLCARNNLSSIGLQFQPQSDLPCMPSEFPAFVVCEARIPETDLAEKWTSVSYAEHHICHDLSPQPPHQWCRRWNNFKTTKYLVLTGVSRGPQDQQ